MALKVVRLRPSQSVQDAQLWDRYVLEQKMGTGYHLSAWGGVIERAFGHETIYLMAVDRDGRACGVLPLVLLSSWVFGRFMVSLPYVNYGGVLADGPDVQLALLDEACAQARALKAEHVELRHDCGTSLAWARKDHKVSMRLDLPQDYASLFKGFTPKLRSQIRRGEKEGMTVESGGIELLDAFYDVFARNMRDLGTPVYGKRFFEDILRTFEKDSRLFVVRHETVPAAAGFVYGFRQTLEIPWASSDKRYARYAPNMLLYGSILKHACEHGYRCFDFGRSSKDSGTYRFKEQWGAKPLQLHWHYWLSNGGELPELNPQNPRYQAAIRVWQRLPVTLTNVIGPAIVKYLP